MKSCGFRVYSSWSGVGRSLGVGIEDRKRLRTMALITGNFDEALEDCLDMWIKNGKTIATWEQLLTAINNEEKDTYRKMNKILNP